MSNTVALALIIIGMVGVCGSVALLAVLAVVWWLLSRVSRKEVPTTVAVHVEEDPPPEVDAAAIDAEHEDMALFGDHDTHRSHLFIRVHKGERIERVNLDETIADPDTDGVIEAAEEEP